MNPFSPGWKIIRPKPESPEAIKRTEEALDRWCSAEDKGSAATGGIWERRTGTIE